MQKKNVEVMLGVAFECTTQAKVEGCSFVVEAESLRGSEFCEEEKGGHKVALSTKCYWELWGLGLSNVLPRLFGA
jgi:hypothetical protein